MSELKRLYLHASHYLGGRLALMLLGFVSFPIFTRIFSVADYGLMSLALKIVLLLTVVGKFGLQNSVQRFYPADGCCQDDQVRKRYYSSLSFASSAVGGSVTAFFVILTLVLPASLLQSRLRYLLLLASLLVVVRALQSTLIGFLRAEGRTKTYNSIEIATKAGTILLSCSLLLLWRRDLGVLFGSTIAVEFLGMFAVLIFLGRRGLLSMAAIDWDYIRKAALFAFPLIGYELASVVLDSGDRFLVQHFMGARSLGFYSAAYNVSTYVEESLMVPINLALFPIYMKLWVEKGEIETQKFLSRTLNDFLVLACAVACIVLLTSREVIVVLASAKFQEADRLLPLLVIGLLVYAVHIFLNAALLVHKRTATMTSVVLYACAANLLLNIFMIPRLGLLGAALATLLSYLLLILLMARVSSRLLPLQIDYLGLLCSALAAGITYTLLNTMQFANPLLGASMKTSVGIVLYGGLLLILRPNLRKRIFGSMHAETAQPGLASKEVPSGELL